MFFFFTIQALSALFEDLFGDSSYNEGDRRQHFQDSNTEMLLMMRRFCNLRSKTSNRNPHSKVAVYRRLKSWPDEFALRSGHHSCV